MPEVRVVAATDPDESRCLWAKDAYDVPVFASLDEVVDQNPDVVDIVAPPPAHAAIIRALLKTGRTLIRQKPFCTSLSEAEAIVNEAREANTRLIIHENFRFQPWHRTIAECLQDGLLAEVYQARFALRPGDGRGPDAYLERQPAFQTMPRLLIHETGVHFIDLFRWLFGDVTSVYADLRQLNPVLKGEDAGLLILEHATGTRAIFDGNRLADHVSDAPRRTMGEMRIEGEGGVLTLDGQGQVTFRAFGAQDTEVVPLPFEPDDSFGGGCVAALNAHVVDGLKGRCAFENTARDYLPVMDITERAYASAETGRKLKMENR
jgi:predicted dehydrogenase